MRSGAAAARQLREQLLAGSNTQLRILRDEAIRRFAPDPIGCRSIRAEQVADGVLAHHGLVANPRLERSQPGDAVDIRVSPVPALQGAAIVAFSAGLLGAVPRPIYGVILLAAGLIAMALLWKAPAPVDRVVPTRLPRGRLTGVLVGGFAVVVGFFGVVLPLRAHYERIGAPPGIVSTHEVFDR